MVQGAYWRVVLGGSRGNIIDLAAVETLIDVFQRANRDQNLQVACIEGRGDHFSFGASVRQHLPEHAEKLVRGFGELFRVMLDGGVVVLSAVRGQCLGGGLELASFSHRLFAAPDARLGQPEIALGVFAPFASFFLAERVGRGDAEDLCLSGRLIDAGEALAMGLADQIAEDPSGAALDYARRHLLPRSASSLRYAVKAVRHGVQKRMEAELPEIERLYLEELMSTRDAVEGIRAFLEKRPAQWDNR
jgi:cyclohexa-1,5-dienecarbonyl-CoA hydratase